VKAGGGVTTSTTTPAPTYSRDQLTETFKVTNSNFS